MMPARSNQPKQEETHIMQSDEQPFDPDSWDGDAEELKGHEEILSSNYELSEQTFASKHDAFNAGLFLGASAGEAAIGASARQFDRQAAAEMLAVIDAVPWGDLAVSAGDVDQVLRLALEATTQAFLLWETDGAGERRYGDEYSLSAADVDSLDDQWRMAYVARLLRSLALCWGVQIEFGTAPLGSVRDDQTSAGTLVRQLDTIVTQAVQRTMR